MMDGPNGAASFCLSSSFKARAREEKNERQRPKNAYSYTQKSIPACVSYRCSCVRDRTRMTDPTSPNIPNLASMINVSLLFCLQKRVIFVFSLTVT